MLKQRKIRKLLKLYETICYALNLYIDRIALMEMLKNNTSHHMLNKRIKDMKHIIKHDLKEVCHGLNVVLPEVLEIVNKRHADKIIDDAKRLEIKAYILDIIGVSRNPNYAIHEILQILVSNDGKHVNIIEKLSAIDTKRKYYFLKDLDVKHYSHKDIEGL